MGMPMFVYLFLHVHICVSMCICVSPYLCVNRLVVSITLSLTHAITLFLSICLSPDFSLFLFLSISLAFSLFLSFSICLSPTLSLFLSLSLSVCLSPTLSLSLYLSLLVQVGLAVLFILKRTLSPVSKYLTAAHERDNRFQKVSKDTEETGKPLSTVQGEREKNTKKQQLVLRRLHRDRSPKQRQREFSERFYPQFPAGTRGSHAAPLNFSRLCAGMADSEREPFLRRGTLRPNADGVQIDDGPVKRRRVESACG